MRGGVILIAIALVLAYVAITGRNKCFTCFFKCLSGDDCECGTSATVNKAETITNLTQPFQKFVTLPPITAFK